MNILYLCHRIPYPPDKGDKIRSFHQVEYLSRSHRLHVGCLIDAEEDRAHVAALQPYCATLDAVWRGRAGANARAALALFGKQSLSVAAFYSPDLARRIERRIQEEAIDVTIVFSSQMGQYVPSRAGFPTVVDYVDVDSEKWRVYADMKPWPLSWVYRIEADRLRRYETTLALSHEESVFVAEKEADVFRRGGEGVRARVISNGVDLNYFARPAGAPRAADPPTVVFVGMMDYFPNIDAVCYFAEEIFPHVLRKTPTAVFRIVGRNPSKRVRDLARLKNVEVVGAVADVRPHLLNAVVSVAPFRVARGLQNKILEAMAMEVPVVGTQTAFQGITAGPDDGVRIVDPPESFADAVVAFLAEPVAGREAGCRGRRFVEQHHRWEDHGKALVALLEEVVERRAGKVLPRGERR